MLVFNVVEETLLFVVIYHIYSFLARTDARGTHGLDECIKRSKAYIDAGADMIFPEGLHTKEEMAVVAKELKLKNPNIYLLANMTEFGKTPYISLKEFE